MLSQNLHLKFHSEVSWKHYTRKCRRDGCSRGIMKSRRGSLENTRSSCLGFSFRHCGWINSFFSVQRQTQTAQSNSDNQAEHTWRRDRDSNPGRGCPRNGFRDRPVQPLRHPSVYNLLPTKEQFVKQDSMLSGRQNYFPL